MDSGRRGRGDSFRGRAAQRACRRGRERCQILGIFFAQTDTAGNVVIPEDRIRFAMESAGSDAFELHRELRLALGQAWDDELESFRHASEDSPVVWLHKVG